MKRLVVLLFLIATPLLAQDRDMDRDMQLTAWVSSVQIDGDDDFSEGFATDFEDGKGYGLSVNRFVTRMISVEASTFYLRNDARLLLDGVTPIDLGAVSLRPISLGAQLHMAGRSRFDPYVGAGGAYVIAGRLLSPALAAGGVGKVDLENGFTYYVNAGIGVRILEGLAVVADARYLPFETDSRSEVTDVKQEIDLTTKSLSLGLRLRF